VLQQFGLHQIQHEVDVIKQILQTLDVMVLQHTLQLTTLHRKGS